MIRWRVPLPSEAHHLLYLLYGLEVPADVLHVTHIMNSQSDLALKDTIVGVHIQMLDVDIQLLGQHTRNLVKHAHMVDAIDMDGGREEQFLVSVPVGSKDMIAVAGFQLGSYLTLPLMDGDIGLPVKVAQHIISRNRMTTTAEGVAPDGFLVEYQWLLLIDDQGH